MVFAPPPCDRLHGLAFEGEPGLSLRRVRGQRVLEATEGLALSQRLPERPGEAVIAALIDEVLHDAEGLGRPIRDRIVPDSMFSQWLHSPSGSREFSPAA